MECAGGCFVSFLRFHSVVIHGRRQFRERSHTHPLTTAQWKCKRCRQCEYERAGVLSQSRSREADSARLPEVYSSTNLQEFISFFARFVYDWFCMNTRKLKDLNTQLNSFKMLKTRLSLLMPNTFCPEFCQQRAFCLMTLLAAWAGFSSGSVSWLHSLITN